MKIGVLKEIKKHEYRVGLTPDAVSKYIAEGHTVVVETSAGSGTGFTDDDYVNVGATILSRSKVFAKTKSEYDYKG